MDEYDAWPLALDSSDRRPAVVLLHAYPLDRRMWTLQREALSSTHRVLAIDLPGFGESPLRPGGGMDDWAELLEDVIDAVVGDSDLVLVGLSMGGYLALRIAARRPLRLRGLVLADSRAAADTAEVRAARDQAIFTVRRLGMAEVADRMIPKLLSGTASAELVGEVRRLILAQRPEAAAAALAAMRDRPDSTAILSNLQVPLLAIAGAEDELTPPSEVEAMARLAPESWFVRLPRAGHLANLEAPNAFTRVLAGFVAGLTL